MLVVCHGRHHLPSGFQPDISECGDPLSPWAASAASLAHTDDKDLIPMISQTFRETLEVRDALLHKKAVLKEVLTFLEQFLDTDSTPATTGITTDGSGLTVPQPIIEEIRGQIESNIKRMESDLDDLNNMRMENHGAEGKGRKKVKAKVKAKGGAGSSEEGPD